MCLLQGGELHILVCHFDLPVDCIGFPYSSVSKESACNARDTGSIPGSRISPGEGNGNRLQCSCLENPVDRGAWQAPVHKLDKWVPHKLTANKKNCLLKVSSSLILRNNKPFLNRIVACDEKVMTSSVAGLRRCSKPLPKANLAPKKGHDHCLLVCCQSDPL